MFRDASARAARAQFAKLGDGMGVLKRANGSETPMPVMLDMSVEVPDASGQYLERARVVSLLNEELPAPPVPGDQVKVLTTWWVVQRLVADDGIVTQLAVA